MPKVLGLAGPCSGPRTHVECPFSFWDRPMFWDGPTRVVVKPTSAVALTFKGRLVTSTRSALVTPGGPQVCCALLDTTFKGATFAICGSQRENKWRLSGQERWHSLMLVSLVPLFTELYRTTKPSFF